MEAVSGCFFFERGLNHLQHLSYTKVDPYKLWTYKPLNGVTRVISPLQLVFRGPPCSLLENKWSHHPQGSTISAPTGKYDQSNQSTLKIARFRNPW